MCHIYCRTDNKVTLNLEPIINIKKKRMLPLCLLVLQSDEEFSSSESVWTVLD